MDFAAPKLLLVLIAAPGTALLCSFLWRRRRRHVAAWSASGLWNRLLPTYRPTRMTLGTLALTLAVIGLALALARPRWGSVEQTVERTGVDVVFVLDTSLSMATRDVQPSRLWVAQSLVRDMARSFSGERVALVQAEGDGVVMAPLTVDSAVIDLLLDAVAPGSLPTPGTELGPALERGIDLFAEGTEGHRVMIVLSDGEDHGRGLAKATSLAKDAEVVVHAIGVGTPEGLPLELPQAAGKPVEYKTDENGNVVVSRLEERTLESLSRETGGVYIRATSAATRVEAVVDRVSRMTRRSIGEETITALEERFQLPLALAIASLLIYLVLPIFARRQGEVSP